MLVPANAADSQRNREIVEATKWLRAIMKRDGITELTILIDGQKVKFAGKAKKMHRLRIAKPCN